MMSKEDFVKGITFLGIAYNKPFDEKQLGVWYEFFKETNYDLFKQAIKRIISKKQFMPSIAELKHEIALIGNPVLQLSAEKEWVEVIEAVHKYGMYREEEAMNSLKPYTRYIARLVGFRKICLSESIQWEKREFIELFNSNKERDEIILLTNEKQMTLTELKRIAELREDETLMIE